MPHLLLNYTKQRGYSVQKYLLIYRICSLRRGPGANVQDASGYTALHHAALNGHRYAFKFIKIICSK